MERKVDIEEVTNIFRKVFNEPLLVLKDEMSSKEVENWDSMNYMLLINEIENKYGFKFKLRELTSMKNVKDIIDTIETRINRL